MTQDQIFEFQKLRFEINYTANNILIDYSDLEGMSFKLDVLKERIKEWELRAGKILELSKKL